MKLVHWPLMGRLLQLVQRWRDWAGPQPAQARPRCTKCNSPPINGQCIPVTVLLYNDPLLCGFNLPILRPVYSDATQLNSTLSWVELRRYKRAFRVNVLSVIGAPADPLRKSRHDYGSTFEDPHTRLWQELGLYDLSREYQQSLVCKCLSRSHSLTHSLLRLTSWGS